MPLVYATVDDLRAYSADLPRDLFNPGDDQVERALERAERDVDRAAGPWPVFSNGRKFDPPSLTAPQRAALTRATCAAAEFRLIQTEELLVGSDDGISGVPGGVTFANRPLPRIGPKLIEELAGSGLFLYSGTLAPEPEEPPVEPEPVIEPEPEPVAPQPEPEEPEPVIEPEDGPS